MAANAGSLELKQEIWGLALFDLGFIILARRIRARFHCYSLPILLWAALVGHGLLSLLT